MVEDRVQRRLAANLAAEVVGDNRLVEANEAEIVVHLRERSISVPFPKIDVACVMPRPSGSIERRNGGPKTAVLCNDSILGQLAVRRCHGAGTDAVGGGYHLALDRRAQRVRSEDDAAGDEGQKQRVLDRRDPTLICQELM